MSGDGYVRFLVRFPSDLLAALKRWAQRNERSVTGEIIFRLRASIRSDERKER